MQDAERCWGAELLLTSAHCTPGFVQGRAHFKNHFCPSCRKGPLLVPADRTRALTDQAAAALGGTERSTQGFWKLLPSALGEGYMRILNNTVKCRGPKLVCFRGQPPDLPWAEMPVEWLSQDRASVPLHLVYGTLGPLGPLPPPAGDLVDTPSAPLPIVTAIPLASAFPAPLAGYPIGRVGGGTACSLPFYVGEGANSPHRTLQPSTFCATQQTLTASAHTASVPASTKRKLSDSSGSGAGEVGGASRPEHRGPAALGADQDATTQRASPDDYPDADEALSWLDFIDLDGLPSLPGHSAADGTAASMELSEIAERCLPSVPPSPPSPRARHAEQRVMDSGKDSESWPRASPSVRLCLHEAAWGEHLRIFLSTSRFHCLVISVSCVATLIAVRGDQPLSVGQPLSVAVWHPVPVFILGWLAVLCAHLTLHPRPAAQIACFVLVAIVLHNLCGALMAPTALLREQMSRPRHPSLGLLISCIGAILGGHWHLSRWSRCLTFLLFDAGLLMRMAAVSYRLGPHGAYEAIQKILLYVFLPFSASFLLVFSNVAASLLCQQGLKTGRPHRATPMHVDIVCATCESVFATKVLRPCGLGMCADCFSVADRWRDGKAQGVVCPQCRERASHWDEVRHAEPPHDAAACSLCAVL